MASWDNRVVTNEHLLPYVDSNTAPPDIKAALQTLPFERNIFKLLANSNVFFKPFMTLLSSSWSENRKILPSEWQTTVLRTAATLDAPYEWDVNEPVARVLGLTEEQFSALRNPKEPLPESLFTPRQRLIARIVEELSRQPRTFSHEEITEIFFLNGIYGFLARFMNSARIDFDEPIPGLLDILRKYNASAIEREKQAKK
ncbi:AhpD-like protein [Fusarium sp. MPI-SDFR-AT-0072]|nr:AhpD-like protein [Fusarium sp. MPI-SDFR-AT-0072]